MGDFSITYSFGGTQEAPLVRRTITMDDADPDVLPLQEILLERTDKLIADLCAVFDEAEAALQTSAFTDGRQVEVAMGAAAYCVNNILAPSPSAKYAHMFTRVQRLLNYAPQLRAGMGDKAAQVMLAYTLPVWETLRTLDGMYAEELRARPTTG
jgi:hypothetical protein